jgi:hypothetical protein
MTKGSKNIPPRPTSNYLLAYKGNEKQLEPMTKHAYIAFLPVQEFGPTDMTSATEIRNTWPALNDKRKQAFAMSLYPATQQNSKLLATVVNILNRNIGSTGVSTEEPQTSAIKQLKAKKLREQIQRMRPLLKEASFEQKYKLLKLMKEATQLDEVNLFKKKTVEPTKVEPETSPNDYHAYFNKPEIEKQKVYRNPEEYVDATKKDPLTGKKVVDEFSPGGNFQPPKPPKNKGNDPWGDDDDDDYSSRPRGPNIIGKQLLKLQQQKKRIIWRPWLYDGQPDIIAIIKNVKPTEYDPNLFEFTYSWKTSGGKWIKRNTFINPGSESIYSLIPYNDYTYELRQTEESGNDNDDLNEASQQVNEISDETIHSYLSKADRQISNRLDRMSQARERLNKNYEIYDVNNPTKIIDKFEANTPELARRYFEKFIKEYNPGDQNFEFEVRRSTGLSEEAVAEDYLPEK